MNKNDCNLLKKLDLICDLFQIEIQDDVFFANCKFCDEYVSF